MFGVVYWISVIFAMRFSEYMMPSIITTLFRNFADLLLGSIIAYYSYPKAKRWLFKKRVSSKNKSVFISGCDRGFGFELAKKLDSLGYKVFAGCLFPKAESAEELEKNSTNGLRVVQLDVTSEESVRKARDYVRNNLGNSVLWAVVNNAGIHQGFDVGWGSMEPFEKCHSVNSLGPVRVTKAFLPMLIDCQGRVITITSMIGKLCFPHCAPYCMSKFAASAFSECLRMEMKLFGVKSISIEPEFFKTSLSSESLKNVKEEAQEYENVDLYGSKYVEDVARRTRFYSFASACSNISLVVDSICDAISLEKPDDFYRPCRSWAVRLLLDVGIACPSAVQQALFAWFQDFWKWPVWKILGIV